MILDGALLRDKGIVRMSASIKEACQKAGASFVLPHLAIVQVGDRQDSNAYIAQKVRFGEKIGAKVTRIRLPVDISQEKLEEEVEKWSDRDDVHGVILQLPITQGLDSVAAIEKIDPRKDVDGLTSANKKTGSIVPATTRGILELLHQNGIEIAGKKAVVIGRSQLVGMPTARAFADHGASVSVINSTTENPQNISVAADIVVVATGKLSFFGKDYFSKGQVVVDVGINPVEEGIQGDVRFNEVAPLVKAISPVPGGVGPMTVLSLFENLLDAYAKCYTT